MSSYPSKVSHFNLNSPQYEWEHSLTDCSNEAQRNHQTLIDIESSSATSVFARDSAGSLVAGVFEKKTGEKYAAMWHLVYPNTYKIIELGRLAEGTTPLGVPVWGKGNTYYIMWTGSSPYGKRVFFNSYYNIINNIKPKEIDAGPNAPFSWSEVRGTAKECQCTVIAGTGGRDSSERYAFRWTEKNGMTFITDEANHRTTGYAISPDGHAVVGSVRISTHEYHAFLWTKDYGFKDLGTLGGDHAVANVVTSFTEVDSCGCPSRTTIVAGISKDKNNVYRVFRWTVDAGMQNLGSLEGPSPVVTHISNDGSVIVGEDVAQEGRLHVFRWSESGGMEDMGTMGMWHARPTAIYGNDVIVGYADTSDGPRSFVFKYSDAQLTVLPTLGGSYCVAEDVGETEGKLVIVGTSETCEGNKRAFIWTADDGIQELNSR